MIELLNTNTIMFSVPFGKESYDLSYIEAIATISGLICIYLASLEKTINYFFGLINVTLFAIIFFQINLYASLLLQIFFFIANIYGWYAWSRINQENKIALSIRWLNKSKLMVISIISLISILIMMFYIDVLFDCLTKITINTLNLIGLELKMPYLEADPYPFWDSTMLVLSVIAQILMTRKYVENWILWIVINFISIYIYALQGVYFVALEYTILLFIAANGLRIWRTSVK